jgi:hypothetical protein
MKGDDPWIDYADVPMNVLFDTLTYINDLDKDIEVSSCFYDAVVVKPK